MNKVLAVTIVLLISSGVFAQASAVASQINVDSNVVEEIIFQSCKSIDEAGYLVCTPAGEYDFDYERIDAKEVLLNTSIFDALPRFSYDKFSIWGHRFLARQVIYLIKAKYNVDLNKDDVLSALISSRDFKRAAKKIAK